MFGISGSHLLILVIVLLIFGPRRLPELGSTLGKAMRNFKDGLSGVQDATYKHLHEQEREVAKKLAADQDPPASPTNEDPSQKS